MPQAAEAGAAVEEHVDVGEHERLRERQVLGHLGRDGAEGVPEVIDGFNKQYPNVNVTYTSKGNDIPTVLATAIAGGNPADMADVAQPGLVKQFVQQGHLKPITYAKSTIATNFSPAWVNLGVVNGKLYALLFKASNKSTLWYNVHVFKQAGVQAPKTWSQMMSDAKTIKASGTPAYSLCGSSGWTLTDIFENIYLRMWGAAKYNAALGPPDQVDRPVGDEGAPGHGADRRQHLEPLRRHERGPADRLPDVRRLRVRDPARRRRWSSRATSSSLEILQATKAKPVKDFNVVPFPTITSGPDAQPSRPAAT